MASAPVNVRVGTGTVGVGAGAADERPREVEATVEPASSASSPRRPTMREIVERAAGLAEVGSVAADNLGAEGAADAMRRSADLARKTVVAADGVKREVEPVATAAKGLWKSMEERGWVGVRPPVNIAALQGRDRPRRSAKKEGE